MGRSRSNIKELCRSNLSDRFATTDAILDQIEYWPDIESNVGKLFESKAHFQARLNEFRYG